MTRVDVNFEGESRHYLMYKPSTDIKTTSLVVGIHGYTGTASGFEKETTGGFNLSADKYNFIAVYPQGTYFYENKPFGRFLNNTYVSSWNDLTGSKTITPDGETCAADEHLILNFLIAKVPMQEDVHGRAAVMILDLLKKLLMTLKKNIILIKYILLA